MRRLVILAAAIAGAVIAVYIALAVATIRRLTGRG
jgi:hypothetical protein